MQEVWLCDNIVSITRLPLKAFEEKWRREHLASIKKDQRSKPFDVSISNFLEKESSNLLFLEKK